MRTHEMMNFRRCEPCDNETQWLDPVADSKEITSTLSPTSTTQKVEKSLESNIQTDTKIDRKTTKSRTHVRGKTHSHTAKRRTTTVKRRRDP